MNEEKLMTQCMKCEETITAGEAWENQGLCVKCWEIAQQDAIYWRGWLEQVMSEYLAEGISEKTKEKVLEALKNNRF